MRRGVVSLLLGILAACGGRSKEPPPSLPAAPAAETALPVAAPMEARERMLQDLETQSRQARDRASALLEVLDRDD